MKNDTKENNIDFAKIEKDITDDNLTKYTEQKNIILNKTKLFYITVFTMNTILILIDILMFILMKNTVLLNMIIKIIYNVILGIYLFIMTIYLIARFFFFGDLERLKGYFIIKGNNFIGANFFLTQKRIFKKYYPINDDGKTFSTGSKDYIIENSCIWLDNNNIPNSFYVPNLPNPISFDFLTYFTKYFSRLERGESEKNIKENLDLRYSAENLRLLKNDKIMKELHRDKSEDYNKLLIYFMIGLGICLFVIVIIVIVLGNKQTVVTIAQNSTNTKI